jgi:hypothetical protein
MVWTEWRKLPFVGSLHNGAPPRSPIPHKAVHRAGACKRWLGAGYPQQVAEHQQQHLLYL